MNLAHTAPPSVSRRLAVVAGSDHHRAEVADRFLNEGDQADVIWFRDAAALLQSPQVPPFEAVIVFPDGDPRHADQEEATLRENLRNTPVFVVS